MNITKKKALLVVLVLVALVGVAYASYWVYSEIIHVHVGSTSYTLSLSIEDADIVLGEKVGLYGHLKLGETYVDGATIHIYLTDASGNIVKELGTTTTYLGYFYFYWTPTETGDYYFKAGYEVTA